MSTEYIIDASPLEYPDDAVALCSDPLGSGCAVPAVDPDEAVFLDQVFPVFRARVTIQRHLIRAAWACRDLKALHHEVHALKGTAGTFGMAETSRLAQELIDELRADVDERSIERDLVRLLTAISPKCMACYGARLHALAQGEGAEP